ncbi:sugar ABC transporter ATP-binding protein [Devosia sp. 2618]|uniref:sugar ABC transporter ATP-binding protein n=1 Tax=Devosia sp. 2618 TaxID=3156454 RepID=UPI003397A6B1
MTLVLENIVKSFPGVRALNNASLSLNAGEIHALMGENGAGKSTLIKVITGVHTADEGTITLDGRALSLTSPQDAIALGIAVVHQERNLIPHFSIAENILLERLPTKNGFVDFARANQQAKLLLAKVGLDLDPAMSVSRLSVAQMQMVEIAKALNRESKVLLLDEPTASLTDGESETLFRLVRQLRDNGTAILFVSHKLEEVLALCDRITVLRDGQTALAGAPIAQMSRSALIEAMIGRAETPALRRKGVADTGTPRLQAKSLATSFGHENINFSLHRGEILGLYGLVGAGRTELARALLGLGRIRSGELLIDGEAKQARSVKDAIKRLRLGYVSEDRKHEGVILSQSISRNISSTVWDRLANGLGLLRKASEDAIAIPLAEKLAVRTPSVSQLVGNLSGGNQQKVSFAKWLAADVDILIIDEPTVGVDVKAKAYIHEIINGLADDGMSILLISSDMPEMIAIADRLLVMHDFAIQGEIANDRNYDSMSRRIMSAIHTTPIA